MKHLIDVTKQIEERLKQQGKLLSIPKDEAIRINQSMGKKMVVARREAERNQRSSRIASSNITLNS